MASKPLSDIAHPHERWDALALQSCALWAVEVVEIVMVRAANGDFGGGGRR